MWRSVGVQAQTMGGYTQPYRGAQPWTIEPVSTYYGLNGEYSETRFSSVRLAGLPLDDPAAVALGVYLPIDADGDGNADTYDGKPMYAQRDVRDVQPAGQEVETGVRVGRHYLYYRFELGGWAVHTQVCYQLRLQCLLFFDRCFIPLRFHSFVRPINQTNTHLLFHSIFTLSL